MRLLGIGDNNERVVVRGSDFEMMQMVAEEIRYLLDEQEFVQHTHVSYTPRQPEINLNFDPILLTTYDINRANITSGLTKKKRRRRFKKKRQLMICVLFG